MSERELREATQEDVDALNAVVAHQEKRIAKLEDWQRRAAETMRGKDCVCGFRGLCSRCEARAQLLSEAKP
jgi:hypothetical protein